MSKCKYPGKQYLGCIDDCGACIDTEFIEEFDLCPICEEEAVFGNECRSCYTIFNEFGKDDET